MPRKKQNAPGVSKDEYPAVTNIVVSRIAGYIISGYYSWILHKYASNFELQCTSIRKNLFLCHVFSLPAKAPLFRPREAFEALRSKHVAEVSTSLGRPGAEARKGHDGSYYGSHYGSYYGDTKAVLRLLR